MNRQRSRILFVEDDAALRRAVASTLAECDYEVLARPDGSTLAADVEQFRPDLALVDVGLPAGPSGFDLARDLRSADVAVMFVTAADSVDDRLRGFDLGADDYVVKPFPVAELLARVRAVLRRTGRLVSPSWEVLDLLVDERARRILRNGVDTGLTRIEYEILCALARRPGKVLSKVQLLSLVWGFDEFHPNLVEVHVCALRRKLEALGPRVVHTERGEGYVLRK